jgi:hypothetical protein
VGWGGSRQRRTAQRPQQRVRADEQAKGTGDPCGGLPSGKIDQFPKRLGESGCLAGIPRRHGWKPFGEDAPLALAVVAEEFAHRQHDSHRVSLPGQVQQRAAVSTVDAF